MPAIAWLRRHPRRARCGALFAAANIGAMIAWPSWETIPFHFVWISLTLVYGFRVWTPQADGADSRRGRRHDRRSILADAFEGIQLWGELFEVPLMSAMFLAMVWHARRRVAAVSEAEARGEQRRCSPAGALPARRLPRAAHAGDDRARPSRAPRAHEPKLVRAHCRARRAGPHRADHLPAAPAREGRTARIPRDRSRSTSRRSSRTSSCAGPRSPRAPGGSARSPAGTSRPTRKRSARRSTRCSRMR